jgi:hypothetical protein
MEMDLHCMGIIQQFVDGKISQEHADQELRKHGDLLTFELLNAGFSVRGYANSDEWKDIVGSTGT